MNTYYVVIWDFEIEESGDVVKDGVVFTDLESAQKEYREILFASINADFSARSKPRSSKRIGKSGYCTGETGLLEVDSEDLVSALQEALTGGGKEVSDN